MRIVTIKKGVSMSVTKKTSSESLKGMPVVYNSPKAIKGLKLRRHPVLSTNIRLSHHPFLKGVGSLGNLLGKNPTLEEYLRGSIFQDMVVDWNCVGNDLSSYLF